MVNINTISTYFLYSYSSLCILETSLVQWNCFLCGSEKIRQGPSNQAFCSQRYTPRRHVVSSCPHYWKCSVLPHLFPHLLLQIVIDSIIFTSSYPGPFFETNCSLLNVSLNSYDIDVYFNNFKLPYSI